MADPRLRAAALHHRADGRFLGRGGLHYWPQFDAVEVGWVLRAAVQFGASPPRPGARWVRWGLTHLDVPYVTAYIAPEDRASVSVAQRLGMSALRTDIVHGREVVVFALPRRAADVD